ncbi:MAG: class I SAM-dependent RNA methyltransferase [Deltaproteobacteria bacterium]|nr:class I SAM-dependent RNA methyltransferase [Deltaproteobacteria bacterium]MBW2660426.1 class I SAM-dependent RNA methyltransferase [Deltaproteobacteria bacterium]
MVTIRRRSKHRVAAYKYQQDSHYFIQIAEDLKEAGAEELAELGAEDIVLEFRGIHFRADKSTLYRINYLTRLASRCLAPLVSFNCHDADTLYKKAKQIQWEDFFAEGCTFAVSANVSDSTISHSKYASLRLKDAVADYFRKQTGTRPDVSVRDPDILLNLYIRHDKAEISLDTSGGALHKRGYREETVLAPMQETIAAAIIRFTEWNGSVPLYDPMCGSGTLLCEALMWYCNIPSGIFRNKFGFEFMPDFNSSIWKQVKKKANTRIRELPQGLIAGSDLSEQAVDAARINIMGLNYGKNVRVKKADFRELPAIEGQVVVANPPYGIRMGGDENLEAFYKDLGDFLKQKCKGSTAYIYFGERRYIKKIGLKASWKKPIKAGGLDGRLVKYEMY